MVKEIFRLSLSGVGTDRIARILNEKAIPTRMNGYKGEIKLNKSKGKEHIKRIQKKDVKWSGNTIRGIIRNKMFYGKKTIDKTTFNVPAVFDYNYWHRVNHNHKYNNSNTEGKGGTQKYEYLLRNLIVCGRCSKNYTGKTRKDKKDHFYYCMSKRNPRKNCGNRSINIDKIEELVWRSIFLRPEILEALKIGTTELEEHEQLENELKLYQDDLSKQNQARTNIVKMVKVGALTSEEVFEEMSVIREKMNQLDLEIVRLKKRIEQLTASNDFSLKKGRTYYDSLDINSKRSILDSFIQELSITWIEGKSFFGYYLVRIKFKIEGVSVVFTNGMGMDLDSWYILSSRKDGSGNEFVWGLNFKAGKIDAIEVPFKLIVESEVNDNGKREDRVKTVSVFDTIIPFGDIKQWTEEEIINYYGKSKYSKLKEELEHKKRVEL